MALSNPLDLFGEFNTLNGGGVDTSGIWTIESAPSFPVTICTSCDGGSVYADVPYTAAGQILCDPGVYNPFLDLDGGGACATADVPDGEYVFKYSFIGSCPEEAFFTITVTSGVADITFSRTKNACFYLYNAENPITGTQEMNYLTPFVNQVELQYSVRLKVTRLNLDNCLLGVNTISNSVANYNTDHRGQITSPLGGGINIKFKHYYAHKYLVDTSAFVNGATIANLRLYRIDNGTPTVTNLNLNLITYNGNATAFAASLQAEVASQLTALGANEKSAHFSISYNLGTGNLEFTFLCSHLPDASYGSIYWVGIDKNDYEVLFCKGPHDCGYTGSFEQGIYVTYTNPTNYNLTSCNFYQSSSSCYLSVQAIPCLPLLWVTDEYVIDYSNSNYNEFNLITGPKPNLLNYDWKCE